MGLTSCVVVVPLRSDAGDAIWLVHIRLPWLPIVRTVLDGIRLLVEEVDSVCSNTVNK